MVKLFTQKIRKCGECPNCIEKNWKNSNGYCYVHHYGEFSSKKYVKLNIIDDECLLEEVNI